MEIMPTAYYENLKRYWRRKKYQRLNGNSKKKLKVLRLGGPRQANRRMWKIRKAPKLQLKVVFPIKLLVKIHDAYVDMMIRVANNLGKASNNGLFRGKKVAKGPQVTMVSSRGEEVIDSRLVLEICKRLADSRELRAF